MSVLLLVLPWLRRRLCLTPLTRGSLLFTISLYRFTPHGKKGVFISFYIILCSFILFYFLNSILCCGGVAMLFGYFVRLANKVVIIPLEDLAIFGNNLNMKLKKFQASFFLSLYIFGYLFEPFRNLANFLQILVELWLLKNLFKKKL